MPVYEAAPAASDQLPKHQGKGKRKRVSDDEGPIQAPKRRKQDTPCVPGDSSAELPPDAPAWLKSASRMLRSEALGIEWMELVKIWEAFETGEGFSSPGKLAAAGRPRCVADWIQRARAPAYRASITKPTEFGHAFMAWWTSLQPKWRQSAGAPLAKTPGDYDDIRKPGVNGLLSAVAALFFWGLACGSDGRGGWLGAVEEVGWTFRQLVEPPAGKEVAAAP